jgi:hypothetical protein
MIAQPRNLLEWEMKLHFYPIPFPDRLIMQRAQRYYQNLCLSVAEAADLESESKVAGRFAVTKKFVWYWNSKLNDANFHPGELGGAHNTKFDAGAQILVERILWELIQIDDKMTNTAYAAIMTDCGVPVDRK